MSKRPSSGFRYRPGLAFALLAVLFATLWLTGGAARGDALGQVLTRGVTWVLLGVAVIFGGKWRALLGRAARPVAILLLAMTLLVLLQLVPLPPAIWMALPGRELLLEAAAASGQAQPWRPMAIVPAAALNAASSLVVPAATLLFAAELGDDEHPPLVGLLLCLVSASMLVGLLQFSGVSFNNPLVNDTPGQVAGTFANRNHFALFLACGCLLAPVWTFSNNRRAGWRAPVGLGLTLLFVLTILAAGSRAGLLLGVVALGLGLVLAHDGIRRELRHAPRWAFPAIVATMAGIMVAFALASIAAGRAEAISRMLSADPEQDMRSRALPTVLTMVRTYFPVGSGAGSFDPVFRINEPFHLLKATYFNHAHDDFLEVVLTTGLPGLAILLAALGWWIYAGRRAWVGSAQLPRIGWSMLLLILLASAVDYPARTPMMMALVVIAALWLGRAGGQSPLPARGQHL